MNLRGLFLIALAAFTLAGPAAARDWVEDGFDRSCPAYPDYDPAAEVNARSLELLIVAPFGVDEIGWRHYAPAIAREIGTDCAPDTAAFAVALAAWQKTHALVPHGAVTPGTFEKLKPIWQERRPFLAVRADGVCPAPPPAEELADLPAADSTHFKTVQMRRDAAAAFSAMHAAAAAALKLKPEDETLAAFSAYRSPAYDDERCRTEGGCDGVARATCSAHRTGTAVDLVLPSLPGLSVDASVAVNRTRQTSSAAYRWLLVNAGRFGFVNYAYEPWHWEWAGAPPPPSDSR
jgi:hypothetical protein